MPTSRSKQDGQHDRGRWMVTVLLIYGAMCVGLLGFFSAFPDTATQRSQAEKKRLDIESVTANWNRSRTKNLTAEAR